MHRISGASIYPGSPTSLARSSADSPGICSRPRQDNHDHRPSSAEQESRPCGSYRRPSGIVRRLTLDERGIHGRAAAFVPADSCELDRLKPRPERHRARPSALSRLYCAQFEYLPITSLYGVDGLIERAIPQLAKWELAYGWTRRGEGWVAERETSLAQVLSQLLVAPESWSTAAERYLGAVETTSDRRRRARGTDLSEWHRMLVDHLTGSDDEKLLERLPRG